MATTFGTFLVFVNFYYRVLEGLLLILDTNLS